MPSIRYSLGMTHVHASGLHTCRLHKTHANTACKILLLAPGVTAIPPNVCLSICNTNLYSSEDEGCHGDITTPYLKQGQCTAQSATLYFRAKLCFRGRLYALCLDDDDFAGVRVTRARRQHEVFASTFRSKFAKQGCNLLFLPVWLVCEGAALSAWENRLLPQYTILLHRIPSSSGRGYKSSSTHTASATGTLAVP